MSIHFNADEIFTIAQEIERHGAEFYSKAAEMFAEEHIKKMLLGLSKMEKDHERIFAKMREQFLPEQQKHFIDPNGEALAYLRVFAEDAVFRANPCKFLEGIKSLSQIFEKAIELEKDSIAFYVGVQELIPAEWGKNFVYEIIREEKKHIVMLDTLCNQYEK